MYKKINASSSRFGGSSVDDLSADSNMLHAAHSDFVLHEPPALDSDPVGSQADKASTKPRIRSLDAFRGLVMVVMIFVDDTGSTYGGHWDHSVRAHVPNVAFL